MKFYEKLSLKLSEMMIRWIVKDKLDEEQTKYSG